MKKRKGELTRENIIKKSLPIFSVKGYYNTSINDILKATRLTKGGLYAHFTSKESIWYAVYNKAVLIWRHIIFLNLKSVTDPIERTKVIIERHARDYIGGEIFEGGCFFVNTLIELSGQSESMTDHILEGFEKYAKLIASWIAEAQEKQLLKPHIKPEDIGNFIVTSLYGTAALYAGSKNKALLDNTVTQLHHYIDVLKKS